MVMTYTIDKDHKVLTRIINYTIDKDHELCNRQGS